MTCTFGDPKLAEAMKRRKDIIAEFGSVENFNAILSDAARYRKLRTAMSMNKLTTWNEVCNLASVGCYTSDEGFDKYLDEMKL